MDPLYEQKLRDEVIYLHSLWHQGPPRAAASTSAPPARHHNLPPSRATQFKKEKKQKRKRGKNTTNNPSNTVTESNSSPGPEWAVPSPPPPPPTDRWPSLEAKTDLHPPTFSPEEQSRLAAKHAHQHAIKAVTEFFKYNNDDSDSIDSSGDEDDEFMEEDDGREEYSFFFKVFKEDNELRGYYEKNFARGEFSCLVCGALGGKKMGKKYKGCLALVQHSITIAKTKKRGAHRAFGQAVCKVLGWDINELSSIVSLLSDNSLGNGCGDNKESLMAIVENVVSTEGDIVEGKNDEAVPESGSMAIVDNVVSIEGDIVEGKNDEAVPESGSIGTGFLPNGDEGDMGIGIGDNKESSLAIVDNVLTVEGDIVEGKNYEVVPESGANGAGIMPNSDEGYMSSLKCTDADKSLEDIGMVHPRNVQEPAAEGLTNNSLTCPNADQNLGNIGLMLPHHLEKPASEGLTISSLTGPDDQNLENIDMVLSHHLEDPTAEGLLTSVPFSENNGAGNEMQDPQMDNSTLSKENEIEY